MTAVPMCRSILAASDRSESGAGFAAPAEAAPDAVVAAATAVASAAPTAARRWNLIVEPLCAREGRRILIFENDTETLSQNLATATVSSRLRKSTPCNTTDTSALENTCSDLVTTFTARTIFPFENFR